MLSGFMNPLYFLFDKDKMLNESKLEITKKIPYSDLENMTKEDLNKQIKKIKPLEFSHTLEEQIQG